MKFAKGIIVGGLITTGVIMMYNENMLNTKKIVKKGKKIMKNLGWN